MDWRDALPDEMEGLWKLGPEAHVADARGDIRVMLLPEGASNRNAPKSISVKAALCPWLAEPHPSHLFLLKSRLYQAKAGLKGAWKILSGNPSYGFRNPRT